MYALYWNPTAASLAPMAVLEEVDAPYRAILVDTATVGTVAETDQRVPPDGRVPALALPDGRSVFESAGIVIYLADRHAPGRLGPPPDHPDRAEYYQWLLYLATTIYPSYDRFYHADRFVEERTDIPKLRTNVRRHLAEQWAVVERALTGRCWLVGERYSVADIYLAMAASWDDDAVFGDRYPAIARTAAAVRQRPAVARAFARHSAGA